MTFRETIGAELDRLTCRYAFYYCRRGGEPIAIRNCERFLSASIIKIPILYAWVHLERTGEVSRDEICDLDAEPPVEGAGLSWLLQARRLPFHDVLLFMIGLSDNLCTNLVIRRIGVERLNVVFRGPLGLQDTRLERKLMDYEARAAGRENWISARDAVQFYRLRDALTPEERGWVEPMFLVDPDVGLWLRQHARDTVRFWHKDGSIPGVLHDWGYTEELDLYLLTQDVANVSEVYGLLDRLGPRLLAAGTAA